MKQNYLGELNAKQRRVVRHVCSSERKSAVLVIAGAGSGKTKTIAYSVAHLIVRGISSSRIALLVFANAAAKEMVNRAQLIVGRALGIQNIALPWAGTFHSVAARLLRQYGVEVGLRRDFTIKDRADSEELMDLARQRLGYSTKQSLLPKKEVCLTIHSFTINSQKPLRQVLADRFPQYRKHRPRLRKLFSAYQQLKREQNVVDYDDLLTFWLKLMQTRKSARIIKRMFDHVLVDEYQDTNRLQEKILLSLKPTGRGLVVVGDDAQAIYSFRATRIENILGFRKRFLLKPRRIKLEQNYRSTPSILAACNAVINLAGASFSKELWSERTDGPMPRILHVRDEIDQARFIADAIAEQHDNGELLKDQAVLFRASHQSAQLELELIRRGIPFKKYGGVKFLESAHIKDVLAVLTWCENPCDVTSGFRCLKLLEGIGAALANKIIVVLSGRTNKRAFSGMSIPKRALRSWKAFSGLVFRLRKQEEWVGQLARIIRWYKPYLERKYGNAEARLADLDQLEKIVANYETRQGFLSDLALNPPEAGTSNATNPAETDFVVLSTIHSAKGREWRSVSILNVVDGSLPSSRANDVDEERRLLYVAMSRAKNQLRLFVPQCVFSQGPNGRHYVRLRISQFIPKSISNRFSIVQLPRHAQRPRNQL